MSGHTSRIPHWLQEHGSALGLQSADLAVYAALLHECDWRSGITRRVSMATIARLALMRSATTAEASIKRLVGAGVVAIHERGVNCPHLYRLGMIPEALSPQNLVTSNRGPRDLSPQNLVGTPQNLVPQSPESGDDLEENSFKNPGAPPQADDGRGSSTPRISPADEFEAWYAAYPVDRNKTAARREWAKTRTEHPADLLARTKQFARSVQGKDLQFVKHPTTWLRDRMWERVVLPTISPDQRAREIWERHGRPEEGTPGWDAFVAERDDERRAS